MMMRYDYDAAGRRTRLTWPNNAYVTYGYNALGQTTSVVVNDTDVIAAIGYDDLGRRTSLTRGNGTATAYGYDAVSRLSALTHNLAGTGSDQTVGFAYNNAGQITGRTSSNDAYAWGGAVSVDRPYTANGLNQYSVAGPASFCYDANGNLTGDGSYVYRYNAEYRLTAKFTAIPLKTPPIANRRPGISGVGMGCARDLWNGPKSRKKYKKSRHRMSWADLGLSKVVAGTGFEPVTFRL